MDNKTIWSETLARLGGQMTAATFDQNLRGSALVGANGSYTIQAPNELALERLQNRLADQIAEALSQVTGEPISPARLVFVVKAADMAPTISGNGPIQVRDRRKKRRYYIDNEFIDDGYCAVVGPSATSVYGVLVRRANDAQQCWPGPASLARDTGLDRDTVKKALKVLGHYRLIHITKRSEQRIGSNGRVRERHFTPIIDLLDVSEWAELEGING